MLLFYIETSLHCSAVSTRELDACRKMLVCAQPFSWRSSGFDLLMDVQYRTQKDGCVFMKTFMLCIVMCIVLFLSSTCSGLKNDNLIISNYI